MGTSCNCALVTLVFLVYLSLGQSLYTPHLGRDRGSFFTKQKWSNAPFKLDSDLRERVQQSCNSVSQNHGISTARNKNSIGAPPYPSVVNVLDYGANGDNLTDNTAAFQAALCDMGGLGGNNSAMAGGIVFVPRGLYRFSGTLIIPPSVTLEGTFRAAPSHQGLQQPGGLLPTDGSVLLPTGNQGQATGPAFISVQSDATLRGVLIYYLNQPRNFTYPGSAPIAYPWTVELRGNNPAIENCELLNPYQAIDASQNARHYIRNVQGQPIFRGVWIDEIYDIGRVENVHFNPWWSMEAGLFQWQLENGEAFLIARSDWQYLLNTFAFGYNIGYHFIESSTGSCNGNFLGIGADLAWNSSVYVEQSDAWGLLFTNGEFTSFQGPNPTMVVVSPSNRGSVSFSNCAFWGPCNQVALIQGSGTTSFDRCIFNQWDNDKTGRYAINAAGTGAAIVSGCEFHQSGSNQVTLSATLKRAVVTGNVIDGALHIQNQGVKAAQIGYNSAA